MDKLSLTDIKKKNYSDIYHFIYKNHKTSKQSIVQGLQISLPTVNQHLNALLQNGLIEKSGQLHSQVGRRANLYAIIPQARAAIGVEILKNSISIVAVDLLGKEISSQCFHLNFENSDAYFRQVSAYILEFIKNAPIPHQTILGVGFGIQGLVSSDGTQMTYSKILDTEGLTAQKFEKHLDLPCLFIHDSECAAESALWNFPGIQDSIYLSLGHHLGGAIIIQGKIQQGRTGKSGTMEHMTLIPNGKKCYCGQLGCAECYCSADALLKPRETLKTFFQNKDVGRQDNLNRWKEYLEHLAMFINNLHLVIDCTVILGGHLAPYMKKEDFQSLHQIIQTLTAFPEEESFLLHGSPYPDSVATGAALKFIKGFLDGI
ncbi:MAG: ROK family transcriptional regulator [Lachnospiraceae bacterium]|nr:ROK family transcriptional regulator [Lachnospiraceae bacterium]MCI9545933.1 ROK family transcriptional regulator [Lachnospiraceae bacterium]